MASVTVGRLLNVVQLVDDCFLVASPYDFYTVPSGRHARVTVHRIQFGNAVTHNGAFLFFGLIPFNDLGGNASLYQEGVVGKLEYFNSSGDESDFGTTSTAAMRGATTFLLTSGQKITKTNASGAAGQGNKIWVTIEEFANP